MGDSPRSSSLLQVLRSSSLAKNTFWAIGGYVVRLLLQAVYFVIIARCLGPAEYGGFIAVAAMANMISPFVSFGNGSLLIKNVSRDKKLFPECWGNCLSVTIASGIFLTGVAVGLSALYLPNRIGIEAIAFICMADLIFVRVLDISTFAFQAFEQLAMNARLNTLISLVRVIGVIGLALVDHHPTVLTWSAVYLAAAVVSATVALVLVHAKLGRPTPNMKRALSESTEGMYFAVSTSAMTIYNDIDKTMVARLSTLEATGIYGAAYRLIDVSLIPVRALLTAAYPRFFQNGTKGWHTTLGYGRQLFLRTVPYSILAMAGIFIGAPLVPHILGPAYANVTEALRWLSPLPLLKTFQFFIADSLTGAGYQRIRAAAQISVAIFNVLINLWAIPAYGWRGAAWSSVITDSLLALLLWCIAYHLVRTVPTVQGVEVLATAGEI